MTLGDKLSRLRKENNYTQEQLADILGVSRQAISKWESDVAYPETDKLIRLSALYRCSLDYLVKDDVPAQEVTTQPQVSEMSSRADTLIKCLLRLAPTLVYGLWALLLWAFYAAPFVKLSDNNLYQWFGNIVIAELQPEINALISLGVISGAYIVVLGLLQRFGSKKAKLIAHLCGFAFQVAVFVCVMCLIGVAKSLGLEAGKVVPITAALTGVFMLMQAAYIFLNHYFNHDERVDLTPRKAATAFKKFAEFLNLHKVVAIVIACVLFVGVALSVVLPLTVGNIFNANRVAKIEIGDNRDKVVKVLGKPVELDMDKLKGIMDEIGRDELGEIMGENGLSEIFSQDVYYYCSPNAERTLKNAFNMLDKAVKLRSQSNVDDAKILYAQLEKMMSDFNDLEFKYVEVHFKDGGVVEVEYNSKFSTERANDKKWNVRGNKKQKVSLIPNEIPYGENPYSAELYAQAFYTDGSYRLSRVENISEVVGNAASGWVVEWSDHWGTYKRAVKESADSGNVVARGDWNADVSYVLKSVYVDGKEGYSLKIFTNNGMNEGGDVLDWESYAKDVLDVTVSDGVTHLPEGAFANFTSLTSVTLPESLTQIGNNAFYGCAKLTGVNVPKEITKIGNHAFDGCSALTSVTIPDTVVSIGSFAFANCSSVSSLKIPNRVTYIGEKAFHNCENLQQFAFYAYNCTTGGQLFTNSPKLTRLVFDEFVEVIPDNAFAGLTGLVSVEIPTYASRIGKNAFKGCSSLKYVKFPTNSNGILLDSIGAYAFAECTSLESVDLRGLSDISEGMFDGCTALRSVKYYNIDNVGNYAFRNCTSLTSIDVSKIYYSIGDYAFYNCRSLRKVNFSNYIKRVGKYAFANCLKMYDADFPTLYNSDYKVIQEGTFAGCVSLIRFDIPGQIVLIHPTAFENCYSLVEVQDRSYNFELTKGLEELKDVMYIYGVSGSSRLTYTADGYVFYDDGESYSYKQLVKYIGDSRELTLPNKFKTYEYNVNDYAFMYVDGVTSITVPDSVNTLRSYAFAYMPDLQSVKFVGYHNVYDHMFYGCTSLKNVDLGGVTFIHDATFGNCRSLESITIPSCVRLIGVNTFAGCESLKYVYMQATDWEYCIPGEYYDDYLPFSPDDMANAATVAKFLTDDYVGYEWHRSTSN